MRLTTLANILSFFSVSLFVAAQLAPADDRDGGPVISNMKVDVMRAPADDRVTYHGGPVISNVEVVTIFWGGAKRIGIADELNTMYDAVTKSVYMDWLSEYNTDTQDIGRGKLLTSYSYDHAPTGTVSRSTVERLLKNLISTGRVPPPTPNTYYAIHFAPSYYLEGMCTRFCGRIFSCKRTIDPIHIHYGVIVTPTGACRCFFSQDLFEAVSFMSTFNMLASITNPEVGFVDPKQSPKLAWYDPNASGGNPNGGTITDECGRVGDYLGQVVGGNGVTYRVAKGWSNLNEACITSTPP